MKQIISASVKFGSVDRMNKLLSSATRKRPKENKTTSDPVYARVNLGRWLADCECGGAELVDPVDRRFFCYSCGNVTNEGNYRPVVFPQDWREIEVELLNRNGRKVGDMIQPNAGELPREWIPGETVVDLMIQRKARR